MNIVGARSTHSAQLERWLGSQVVEDLSRSMRGWYGPPIAVAGVPGNVWACGDGDFRGRVAAGQIAGAQDFIVSRVKRIARNAARHNMSSAAAGFASLSDLISEATAGKRQTLPFQKVGTTGTSTSAVNTLWFVGSDPAAGAAAAAAPGGTVPTSASTGALPFNNPAVGGDTTHFINAWFQATNANSLLLYDRLFSVTKTMNSTATEAVTGVPTRYTNTVAGSVDSAEGNFLVVEVRTLLPATAHNWTVCLYTDQSGNTGATLPSITGIASGAVNRIDNQTQAGTWYSALATGDTGIKALTQMQCSALVASGNVDFTIGHPIAVFPIPVANLICNVDGINTAFNLTRIFDSACLAFLEVGRAVAGATTFSGQVTICAG